MRLLITAADSPLGESLQAFLAETGRHEVVPLGRAACRWRSERQAKKAVQRSNCDVLVDLRLNAALDGGEEIVEAEVERCHWLAKACQRNQVGYLYVSGSRLFSGRLDRLYGEEDYPDSDDATGQALLQAEECVRDRCERHLVLRLGPVFSHREGNWLPDMMERLAGGARMELDNHLRGNPVSDGDAARVISGLVDQLSVGAERWGIYHYCSADNANAYELAEALLAAASQFSEYDAETVALERVQEAALPMNRALDCRKIRSTFAIKQVPWRDHLANTVKRYFESREES